MKEKKKFDFQFFLYFIIAAFLILYSVDAISYSIQANGYNECLGRMTQANEFDLSDYCEAPSSIFANIYDL